MSDEKAPETAPSGIAALDEAAVAAVDDGAPSAPEVLIITGMSGAGRTRAAAVLEDLDWYVVDNLPAQMLSHLVGMLTHGVGGVRRLAAVVDVRGREFFADLTAVLASLRQSGTTYRILFLDASDEVLVRRYEQVRRPHPLQGDGRILDGIGAEREMLEHVRGRADVLIDSSDLSVHDLAREVRAAVASEADQTLRVHVLSFGFKYGLPLDADHVVDMRFLSNPYWVSELRHLTGHDEPVRDYVLALDGAQEFADRYVKALEPVLAGYLAEEKRHVTIAVGCTGGKHRSVAMGGVIADRIRDLGYRVSASDRDLGKE